MADASTGVLKAVESDTLSNTTKSRTVQVSASKTMTVDKAVKREQPAQGGTASTSTKLGQTGQSSSSAAPRGSPPTQMKAPPGNAATASPKKVDSKGNSPQTEGSPSEPKSSSGKSSHAGVSPTQKDSSKSIKIPKNEVQLLRYFVRFPRLHRFFVCTNYLLLEILRV